MGSLHQWINLIIFLVVVGGGAISWVFKKLNEQAQIKRAQSDRERRIEQELRTGRTDRPTGVLVSADAAQPGPGAAPQAGHADARRRLQELAERRQRQLEELRRRQQASQRGGAGEPVVLVGTPPTAPAPPVRPAARPLPPVVRKPPPVVIMGPGRADQTNLPRQAAPVTGRNVSRTARPAPPPRTTAPAPAALTRDQDGKRRGKERARKAAAEREKEQHRAAAEARDTRETASQLLVPGSPSRSWNVAEVAQFLKTPKTPADWRRAILMREVLSAPITIREDETNGII
jgi:hypothetical protein